jgi:hypothetical protein
MAEIVVGALLLLRLVGPNAGMDRVEHVGRMLVALGVATAISATAGTVSMVAGGVVDESDATHFWRTWWLGDTAGGLVVLPLMLAWAHAHRYLASGPSLGGRRRDRAVTALSVVAFSTEEPIKLIATELAIRERTARTHVSRIVRKLRLSSRTQTALWAVREGLVEVEHELHY